MPGVVGKVQEGSKKNKYWFWPLRSLHSGLSKYNYKYEAGKKMVYINKCHTWDRDRCLLNYIQTTGEIKTVMRKI